MFYNFHEIDKILNFIHLQSLYSLPFTYGMHHYLLFNTPHYSNGINTANYFLERYIFQSEGNFPYKSQQPKKEPFQCRWSIFKPCLNTHNKALKSVCNLPYKLISVIYSL